MANVLIVGCGYVGTALARRLLDAGHRVYGVRRRPERLPERVVPVPADITDPRTLAALPHDAAHVVFAATPDRSDDAAYEATYVGGLRNVLTALRARGAAPCRVVFVSSTAVYGQRTGEWVDEESPTEPRDFRGRRMLAAERAAGEGPWETVVARAAGIYGPGRARLVDLVRRGEAVAGANSPAYGNRIHQTDLAAALEHLLELNRPDRVYLCTDDEPAPRSEVVKWIADRLGVSPLSGTPAATGGRRRAGTNKRCRNARLKGSGFTFRYPTYREGYGELLVPGS